MLLINLMMIIASKQTNKQTNKNNQQQQTNKQTNKQKNTHKKGCRSNEKDKGFYPVNVENLPQRLQDNVLLSESHCRAHAEIRDNTDTGQEPIQSLSSPTGSRFRQLHAAWKIKRPRLDYICESEQFARD